MDFVLPSKNSKSSLNRMTHKEFEKNESKERKRSLLHLIVHYLRDCNLHESADALAVEAQLNNNQYEVCDNIDLDIVLQDYYSYYTARFHKSPKILRKVAGDCNALPTSANNKCNRARKLGSLPTSTTTQDPKQPQKKLQESPPPNSSSSIADAFQIEVTSLFSKQQNAYENHGDGHKDDAVVHHKPALCDFEGYSQEWRETADLIFKEITSFKSDASWDECIGVEHSIELLKEAVVYPLEYPQLFSGLLSPWKGVLLFGPPGTGKTLLAKALASESRATFINLSISTFVSKWRGESEKMLRVLFDVARLYSPCTIFIDELDALASKFEDNQHDASRRFKSELLVQMDGLHSGNDKVFVLAATNCPWNLCSAILRRFEKRILVNVPDCQGRARLFEHFFGKHGGSNAFSKADYEQMAVMSENFSGADVKTVCREVVMCLLREKLEHIRRGDNKKDEMLRDPAMTDAKSALHKFRSTIKTDLLMKYADWARSYGSL